MPKEKYSYAPEIYEHSRRIGKYFDLYDNALFQTRVTKVHRLEDERVTASTLRGGTTTTPLVITTVD
jgi:cyclohexanone monooxygenase